MIQTDKIIKIIWEIIYPINQYKESVQAEKLGSKKKSARRSAISKFTYSFTLKKSLLPRKM
jgi:hypothetical protein